MRKSGRLFLTKRACPCIIYSVAAAIAAAYGPVVQLVRTLACHARGRRFEPVPGRHFAVIAQSTEHFLGKEEVTSSNLVNSSTKKDVHHQMGVSFLCLEIVQIRTDFELWLTAPQKRRPSPDGRLFFCVLRSSRFEL